jgi:hypothetical protein
MTSAAARLNDTTLRICGSINGCGRESACQAIGIVSANSAAPKPDNAHATKRPRASMQEPQS